MPFRKPHNKPFEPVGRVPDDVLLVADEFDGSVKSVPVDPYAKLPDAVPLQDLLRANVNLKEVDTKIMEPILPSKNNVTDNKAVDDE